MTTGILRGSELAIIALTKELKVLKRRQSKAKRDVREFLSLGEKKIALHNELIEITDSDEHGQAVIDKLSVLQKKHKALDRIQNQDGMKLFERESKTELEVANLTDELFYFKLKKGRL